MFLRKPDTGAALLRPDCGNARTLGLLVELRELRSRIGDEHHRMASDLHAILRQNANPNGHGLRVAEGLDVRCGAARARRVGETLRTISLNGNIEVGRAAFDAAGADRPLASEMGRIHRREVRTDDLRAGAPTRCFLPACQKTFAESDIPTAARLIGTKMVQSASLEEQRMTADAR